MYVHVYVYVRMYVGMYACIYVCVLHMYVRTYMLLNNSCRDLPDMYPFAPGPQTGCYYTLPGY